MKKFTFILSVIIASVLSLSCNKDKDGDDQAGIVGKWQVVKIIKDGAQRQLEECDKEITFEYRENGTATETYYCGGEDKSNYTYSVSGNIITIDWGSFTRESTIKILNGKTLILEDTYTRDNVNHIDIWEFKRI